MSVTKPLRTVSVADVQAWMDTLAYMAPASRASKISSVKSLFALGHRLGYLRFDVGRVVKRRRLKDTLTERILSEGYVHKLLVTAGQRPARKRTAAQEQRAQRNYVLPRLLYAAGLRMEEIARLVWRDLQERGDAGQVTVYGKGGRTRVVLLPATWCIGRPERPACRSAPRHTGCGTRMPRMRSNAARPSTWCRPRSATPRWPPRADTCTRDRQTAPLDTCHSDSVGVTTPVSSVMKISHSAT